MRIALVASPELFSSDYRAYQPMGALSARGHEVRFNRPGEPTLQLDVLLRAEVAFIHRFCEAQTREVVQQLREAGVAVVWDNDDDVTDVPAGRRVAVRAGGLESQQRRRDIVRMLELVDMATTPSEVLAAQYREAGAREVRVLENYVPSVFTRARRRDHEGVVVGWTAAGEHVLDLEQLGLRDTLTRLLDAHPELRVMSIGLHLGLPPERYRHVPRVSFLDLADHVAGFDIGIAPLADVAFNRARSNVKLKEYGAVGVPWLASPVGPYVGLGERQGGRLVGDGEWGEAIERLVARERERRKLAGRASRWARKQTVEAHVGEWEGALRDAIASSQAWQDE